MAERSRERRPGRARAYRALVALYPRTFRDEYGADMVQLVRDTCDDEPTWRVASRVVVDLALSIPTQHLEIHMHRNPLPLIALSYTAVAGAGVILAVAGGTSIALLVIGLAVAALAATMANIAWRRAAPAGESIQTQHWWQLVLAGPLIATSLSLAGCGGAEPSTAESEPTAGSDADFCESMEHLIILRAPSGPVCARGSNLARCSFRHSQSNGRSVDPATAR